MRSFSAILLLFCGFFCFAQPDDVGSGRSLYFDGVNDYIELGNVYDDLTFPFTVSAWVRMDPGNAEPRPIFVSNDENNTYDGFWVFVTPAIILAECGDGQGDGNPAFRRGKQALITNSKIEGSWAHIAVVFRSESNIEIFLDGIKLNATPSNGGSVLPLKQNVPNATARIGHHSSGGVTYHFQGYMDEVKLFNIALSQTNIQDQMCKKISSSEPGLIGYWPFNETSGTKAFDSSSTSHDGTFVNNPQRVFSGAPVGDASTYEYNASWTGQKVTMTSGAHTVNVENVVNSPEGIHIYRVDNLPSQTSGIDLSKVSAPYFGVFAARSNYQIERRFDVDYKISGADVCAVHDRKDNSVSSWGQKPKLLNVIERVEFISLSTGATNFDVDLGPDRILCDQASSLLSINVDPTGKSILWSTGETTPDILVTAPGPYRVTVSQDCQMERDTILVSMGTSPPPFSLGKDTTLCSLQNIVLNPIEDASLDFEFLWQDGSTGRTYTVNDYGVYWLKIENACGNWIDSVTYSRPELVDYKIPNIITPNGDPYNQTFQIHEVLIGSRLDVFNRWGKKVFSSANYHNDWDGGDLPVSTYFYKLFSPCLGEFKGTVSIQK